MGQAFASRRLDSLRSVFTRQALALRRLGHDALTEQYYSTCSVTCQNQGVLSTGVAYVCAYPDGSSVYTAAKAPESARAQFVAMFPNGSISLKKAETFCSYPSCELPFYYGV